MKEPLERLRYYCLLYTSETDGLRNRDGPGWHLDRVQFERWLRDIARQRGAELFIPRRVASIERQGEHWIVRLQGGPVLRARFLVCLLYTSRCV